MNIENNNGLIPSEGTQVQPVKGNGNGVVDQNDAKEVMQSIIVVQTLLKVTGELSKNTGITPDILEELNNVCNGMVGKIHAHFKTMFLLSELLAAGYKLAFDDENREIIESHVNALYEDVKDSKEQRFSEAGKIVAAKVLLQMGKTLHDTDGNMVTIDTKDIDMYVVVLDSQHRCMVCTLHPEIDLWMEFVELEGTSNEFYVKYNNLRRNHSGKDQKHMIQQMHKGQVSLLEEIENTKKAYGVTDKFAEALLTGKVDSMKKKTLADIQLGKIGIDNKFDLDINKAQIGIAVMDIVHATYASQPELHKKFKKYQFPMAIWNVYEGKDAEERKNFMYDICGFLKFSDVSTITSIMEKVDNKDFGNVIRPKLSAYVKSITEEEKTKRIAEVDEILKVHEAARNAQPTPNPNAKVKSIGSGSFVDVLANMKALAKQKEEAAAKKAKKKEETSQDSPLMVTTIEVPEESLAKAIGV